MKITHIIVGLDNGGAEAILFQLIKRTRADITHFVISMRDTGYYGPQLTPLGVEVATLNMSKRLSDLSSASKIFGIIKRQKPDLVQTWMYHANLVGGTVAALSGVSKIAWGIHHCSFKDERLTTRIIVRLGGMLSGLIPSAVVFCSNEGNALHHTVGYHRTRKTRVIQNGYDLTKFKPDNNARRTLRSAWNITGDEILIGMVGRWHPCKDHGNLLAALSILKSAGLKFRCVLVGHEMSEDNVALSALLKQNGLNERMILTGPRTDIPDVMNALDIHVLSSSSEAFPNVIAEAMASGTPCAATDVGDVREIIGDAEWTAPPENPQLLAKAIAGVINAVKQEGREVIGDKCRRRIVENFSMERMVKSYRSLWRNLSAQ